MNNQFVKDSLLPDEKILATAKFHPIRIYAIPVLLLIVMGVGIYLGSDVLHFLCDKKLRGGYIDPSEIGYYYKIYGEYLYFHDFSAVKLIIYLAIFLIVIGGILWFNLVEASREEFVITNKRIIAKVGIIRRIAFELQSEQVESIEIHQGIIGRILNYGTLMPCGIGASKIRIPFVVNPFEFRQHIYDLKKPQNK